MTTPLRKTTAESAAGVTPTNYFYDVGDVRRYGAVGDNSTDCTAAFQAAIALGEVDEEGNEINTPKPVDTQE